MKKNFYSLLFVITFLILPLSGQDSTEQVELLPIDLEAIPDEQNQDALINQTELKIILKTFEDSLKNIYSAAQTENVTNLNQQHIINSELARDSLNLVFGKQLEELKQKNTRLQAALDSLSLKQNSTYTKDILNYKLEALQDSITQLYENKLKKQNEILLKNTVVVQKDNLENEGIFYRYLLKLNALKTKGTFLKKDKLSPFKISENKLYQRIYFPDYHSKDVLLLQIKNYEKKNKDIAKILYLKYYSFFIPDNGSDIEKSFKSLFPNKRKQTVADSLVLNTVLDARPGGLFDENYYKYISKLLRLNLTADRFIMSELNTYFVSVQTDKINDAVYFEYSQWLISKKKFEIADIVLNKLELFFPNSRLIPHSVYQNAILYKDQFKQFDKALTYLDKLIVDGTPDEFIEKAHYQKAVIYENKLKDPISALNEYKMVNELFPNSETSLKCFKKRAKIFLKVSHDASLAIEEYRKIIQVFSNDKKEVYTSHNTIAGIYLSIGKFQETIDEYLSMTKKDPDNKYNAKYIYEAAQIASGKLQDMDQAVILYQKVITGYPDSKYAAKAKKGIQTIEKKKLAEEKKKLAEEQKKNESDTNVEENTNPDGNNPE